MVYSLTATAANAVIVRYLAFGGTPSAASAPNHLSEPRCAFFNPMICLLDAGSALHVNGLRGECKKTGLPYLPGKARQSKQKESGGQYKMFINGEFVDAKDGKTFETIQSRHWACFRFGCPGRKC